MSNNFLRNKQIFSYSIIFLSLSLVVSYVEAIFPLNFSYIGIKIGFSNIITIICLKMLSVKRTLLINVLRLIIIGILFGNIVRFVLSVSGFILSFIIMVLLIKILNLSIIISSIFGAIFHNIGQIIALSIITKNSDLFKLIPIYVLIGIVTGFLIGIISNLLYNKIFNILFE